MSPTVELNEVPVIIPLKFSFFAPDVSKNRLNVASPASSVVNTPLAIIGNFVDLDIFLINDQS